LNKQKDGIIKKLTFLFGVSLFVLLANHHLGLVSLGQRLVHGRVELGVAWLGPGPRAGRLPLFEHGMRRLLIVRIDLLEQIEQETGLERLLARHANEDVIIAEEIRNALHFTTAQRVQLAHLVVLPLRQAERLGDVADELLVAVQRLAIQQDGDLLARTFGGTNNSDESRLVPVVRCVALVRADVLNGLFLLRRRQLHLMLYGLDGLWRARSTRRRDREARVAVRHYGQSLQVALGQIVALLARGRVKHRIDHHAAQVVLVGAVQRRQVMRAVRQRWHAHVLPICH
jgi:hypothetical protein